MLFLLQAGRIPLHWACAGGHTELVKFLLEKAGHLDDEDDVSIQYPIFISDTRSLPYN